MRNRKKCILSSFVSMNQGEIIECYGKLSVNKKRYIHPFCTQNTGIIENASSDTESSGNEQDNSSDSDVEQSENVIEIHSVEQLMEIGKQVNMGDSFYFAGNYKLMEDLDLQGKKWLPMGISELTPFSGDFDGNGHAIKNVLVQGNKNDCIGFFGYLKKAVIRNLSIEGTIKGGRYTGGLAGVSEDSTVASCFVSAKVYGSFCAAGFIGKNTGEIKHCYYSGIVRQKSVVPFILSSSAAALCLAGGVCCYLHFSQPKEVAVPYYPPVPIDKDAVLFDHDKPVKGHNKLACSFATMVSAQKGDGMAVIKFKNPGKSNKHVIVQIHITDQELLNTIGSNGRTEEDQEKLDESGTYHPETARQVIAESGTVPPGYLLEEIPLKPLPDGTVLQKGEYEAIVYLVLYDIVTNEKEIVNTNTVVTLKIEN